MSITNEDVKQIAHAIAVANGHPDPAGWSKNVATAFGPPDEPVAAPEMTAPQEFPAENTLQAETPAV